MEVFEALNKRKSVRAYQDRQIPEEILQKIIAAGLKAPCAGAYHMYVIQDKDILKKMSKHIKDTMLSFDVPQLTARFGVPGFDPMYNAPTCIVLSGSLDNPMCAMNAAAAVENMIIAATALGVDSVFSAGTAQAFLGDGDYLEAELGVPADHTMNCGVLLGYPSTGDDVFPWSNEHWGGNKINYFR